MGTNENAPGAQSGAVPKLSAANASAVHNTTLNPGSKIPDRTAIGEFIRRVGVDQIVLIPADRDSKPVSWPQGHNTLAFPVGDVDEAVDMVATVNAGGINCYWSPNQPAPGLAKKADKSEIVAARAVYVDVDPVDGAELASERERIHRLIASYDPQPSITIFSGGGYQAVWFLDAAVPIGGDKSKAAEYERFNRGLEAHFGADSCHNVERVLRLPGTMNWPNAKKRKKGQTPELARVVSINESRYPLANFPQAPVEKGSSTEVRKIEPGDKVPPCKLRELVPDDDLRLRIVDGPQMGEDRSGQVWRVAGELYMTGVDEATIAAILSDPNYGISAHVLAQSDPQRAIERAISRSVAEIDKVETDFAPVRALIEANTTAKPEAEGSTAYCVSLSTFLGDSEPDDDDTGDWAVRGLIAANAPTFFAGHPKSQKTLMFEDLVIDVASGASDWCGMEIPARQRVLIFPFEDAERTTRIRLWQMSRARGFDPRDLEGWLGVSTEPTYWDSLKHVEQLLRTFDHFQPGVAIFDSFSRIHTGNEKEPMGEVLKVWTELVKNFDCSVVCLHHYNGKGQPGDTRAIGHRLRGSSDLYAFARHIVGVEFDKTTKRVTLSTDGNLEYQPEPFAVELVNGETGGKKTIRFEPRGNAREVDNADLEAAVLAEIRLAMDRDGVGMSNRALRDAIPGDERKINAAINRLHQRRVIQRMGKKVGGYAPWVIAVPIVRANYGPDPSTEESMVKWRAAWNAEGGQS